MGKLKNSLRGTAFQWSYSEWAAEYQHQVTNHLLLRPLGPPAEWCWEFSLRPSEVDLAQFIHVNTNESPSKLYWQKTRPFKVRYVFLGLHNASYHLFITPLRVRLRFLFISAHWARLINPHFPLPNGPLGRNNCFVRVVMGVPEGSREIIDLSEWTSLRTTLPWPCPKFQQPQGFFHQLELPSSHPFFSCHTQ